MNNNGSNHQSNGHAGHALPAKASNPLSIFRVNPGNVVHLRSLSESYCGLFTHWNRGRSYYCPGQKDCNPLLHRLGRVWKGYAAVELYSAERKRWVPFVLEISEHLELDFRDVWARGQVWELWREEQNSKKPTPVQGKLQETRNPDTFPPAFDLRAPLLHLYHLQAIDLSEKNPLPPRVFVDESEGEAPKALTARQSDEQPGTAEEWQEKRKRWEERRRSPSEKRAAQGH